VHLSDLSWDLPGEEAVRNYTKGEELETIVLNIEPERERISLGVKQLDKDPLSLFLSEHPKGSIVKGVVKEVDAKMATIELVDGVMGQLRASEISRDRVEDARTALKIGEEIEARFTGVDRKSRVLSLSIKAKEAHEEAQAIQTYRTESSQMSSSATLGDLLKEQMKSDAD
jgi:small subunit ribosomal protein S1